MLTVTEAVRVEKTGDLEALAAANRSMGRSMGSEAIMDLFNRSPLVRLVEHAFGTPVQSVRGAQLATLYPAEDDDKTNEAGYLNRDTPSYGWCPHLDRRYRNASGRESAQQCGGAAVVLGSEYQWRCALPSPTQRQYR